jgi:hydrogenase expression/formation protein HypC
MLLGPLPAGTRVLVHIDAAVRVLDDAEADAIDRALEGLSAALEGQAFEHLFADLIGREPELPAHLAVARPVA